jgi:magnesium chelatase subunit D
MIESIIQTSSHRTSSGLRRELTIGRLAVTLAKLDGKREVLSIHIAEAANLLGIEKQEEPYTSPPETDNSSIPYPESLPLEEEGHPAESRDSYPKESEIVNDQVRDAGLSVKSKLTPKETDLEPTKSRVGQSDTVLETEKVADIDPFPEDHTQQEYVYAPLRLSFARPENRSEERGNVIGVRRTSNVVDLAIVPTLFAAAPYQRMRRRSKANHANSKLLISVFDLRRWRRAPVPDTILVLVLDTTSYGNSNWPEALLSYLREAYVQRASVCVVLVGASGAPNELRAERIVARSVLVPEVLDAFDRTPGKATPLADGLQSALNLFRDALHRGRSTIERGKLVILSDGRGNVPLETSNNGKISFPVIRAGIDDALRVAEELASLKEVQTVLLDPQPQHAHYLIEDLANALEARIELIPLLDEKDQLM